MRVPPRDAAGVVDHANRRLLETHVQSCKHPLAERFAFPPETSCTGCRPLGARPERPNQRLTKDSRINTPLFAWVLTGWGRLPRWCAVTRDQQIRKALELLAPLPRERAECQHDIGLALHRVENG